jgi:hypothetical protein
VRPKLGISLDTVRLKWGVKPKVSPKRDRAEIEEVKVGLPKNNQLKRRRFKNKKRRPSK